MAGRVDPNRAYPQTPFRWPLLSSTTTGIYHGQNRISRYPAYLNSHGKELDAVTIIFERTLGLSDGELNDPLSLEQASQHFDSIKISDPSLYSIMDTEVKELSRLVEEIASTIPKVLACGVRRYLCPECGRDYDRRTHAVDCRNHDLGVQPYVCRGICGKVAWYVHSQSHDNQAHFAHAVIARRNIHPSSF